MPLLLLSSLLLLIEAFQAQHLLSDPRCNLQMDRGGCSQFVVHWYYDRYDHRCRRFYYGGCNGNANRFRTLEECSTTCRYVEPSNRERCFQPHDPGHCDSDIERWYFDKDKLQCVCSWWSGCGGNSNLFYSYNHCMFICGEFAKHGPGIDEKYWATRNRTMPIGAGQRPYQPPYRPPVQPTVPPQVGERPYQPPYQPPVQPPMPPRRDERPYQPPYQPLVRPPMPPRRDERPYQPPYQPPVQPTMTPWPPQQPRVRPSSRSKQIGQDRGRMTTMDYEELKRLHEEYYRKYPTTPRPGQRQPRDEHTDHASGQNESYSSGYAEYRASSSYNSSPYVEFYPDPLKSFQRRARGEPIYRYDTGPIERLNPDGSVTINRQVIYFTRTRTPTLTLQRILPGLVEFTHITPPPPFSTMIAPSMQRRLKNLMKEKIPPRSISPPKPTMLMSEHQTQFDRGSVVQDVTKATIHENYNHNHRPSNHELDRTQSTTSLTSATHRDQGLIPLATQYPSRLRPHEEQIALSPTVTHAEHSLRNSPSPTTRVEAERLDVSRPVVINVPPKKINFDEVLATDSKTYDDYEDTFNEFSFDNTHSQLPTKTASTLANTISSSTIQARQYSPTLAPIVLPPADHLQSQAGSRNSRPVPSSSSRSPSVEGLSAPQKTSSDDDPEKVEFVIQPVGVDN
ncbi:hypothetical protein KIN20_000289 [Parelaphostrongylus tenuis]|uniref:BPTI/Kunitz inhibitor domain-containing protein n=1 Tax=Parelaphostrongylus tenuis TaxID=148309 RepID=A0AAD5LV87_PARTN|nr:hypothetical protein KIN20_000289 [Parelaphostrongylus tenuis]